MKVGLIARAENRGLGRITSELFAHLHPDRTVVVDMGRLARGFALNLDRYPGADVVPFDGVHLDADVMDRFVDGLDVVYSAETFYDWSVIDLAHKRGCATVLHLMPEFLRHHPDTTLPWPTAFWNPTDYLADRMPQGTVEVPIPVSTRLAGRAATAGDGTLRVLHVAGHKAMADRNGTSALLGALRRVKSPVHVTVTTQDPKGLRIPVVPSKVHIEVTAGDVDDYVDLYDGHHLLVMPRRYAGLCLPVQEALGAGLGVVMTDTHPNRRWPIVPVDTSPAGFIRCQTGLVPMVNASPRSLAEVLTRLAEDPEAVADAQQAAVQWAAENTWDRLEPAWRAALVSAVERFTV